MSTKDNAPAYAEQLNDIETNMWRDFTRWTASRERDFDRWAKPLTRGEADKILDAFSDNPIDAYDIYWAEVGYMD